MANLIERREYTPKRFYAGEFPVVTETGTAGGAIALYDLVMSSDTGIVKATKAGIANVVGIAVPSPGTSIPMAMPTTTAVPIPGIICGPL